MRFVLAFLLGIVVALGVYFAGGLQWMTDGWSSYSNVPVAVVETPVPVPAPAPVTTYPGVAPIAPAPVEQYLNSVYGAPPTGYPESNRDAQSNGYETENGYGGRDGYETPNGYEPPSSPEPTYTPPGAVPPVGVVPIGNGPPLSLQISIGRRSGHGPGCEPAYIVHNDTARPIILTERTHYRWNGRGPKDVFIVQPGERQVACAADVYQARDSYPLFDYYRQNVYYGPDAIDLPPPVNIRVGE